MTGVNVVGIKVEGVSPRLAARGTLPLHSDAEVRGLMAVMLLKRGLRVERIERVLGVKRTQVYRDIAKGRSLLAEMMGESEALAG